MKKMAIIVLAFTMHTASILAGQGVVITLEAPIFEDKSWDSPILQRVRKGTVLYIHSGHFFTRKILEDFYAQDPYHNPQVTELIESQENGSENPSEHSAPSGLEFENGDFYLTIDRSGNSAYVPKKYVKLIFNDEREENQSIRPFTHDPTDYRLAEPLPPGYPLTQKEKFRGMTSFGLSTQNKDTHSYPQRFVNSDYGKKIDLMGVYSTKGNFNRTEHLYFGGMLNLQMVQNSHLLNENFSVEESKVKLGIGPYLSYDTYQGIKHRLTLFGSLLFYPYHKFEILQRDRLGNIDIRAFRNFTYGGRLGFLYQRLSFIPSMDLVLGPSIHYEPSQSLTSKDPILFQSFWNQQNPNQIFLSFQMEFNFFLGLQSTF